MLRKYSTSLPVPTEIQYCNTILITAFPTNTPSKSFYPIVFAGIPVLELNIPRIGESFCYYK